MRGAVRPEPAGRLLHLKSHTHGLGRCIPPQPAEGASYPQPESRHMLLWAWEVCSLLAPHLKCVCLSSCLHSWLQQPARHGLADWHHTGRMVLGTICSHHPALVRKARAAVVLYLQELWPICSCNNTLFSSQGPTFASKQSSEPPAPAFLCL